MDSIDAMRLFVRVVETGSFSVAARGLGVGQPTVSKQVAALETLVGAQLLQRSSRGFALTEPGNEFYKAAVRLIEDFEAATALVSKGNATAQGLLRVVGPPTFCRMHVVPLLPGFFARYPGINVEMLTSRGETPTDDGVDVAIHTGELRSSNLVGRRLAETPVVTVATPTFLRRHGTPTSPADLGRFPAVSYLATSAIKPWVFETPGGRVMHTPDNRFRTDDAEQMRIAVMHDVGIANAPYWLFSREIRRGDVVRLFPAFERQKPITALRSGHRRQPAKVRVFIDYLEGALRGDPAISGQNGGPHPTRQQAQSQAS